MKTFQRAVVALTMACLLVATMGCAQKLPGQPVAMQDFVTRFNTQMKTLGEKIAIGDLEASDEEENLYTYWFANAIMIRVYTQPGTKDVVSFSIVSDHEAVGLKTESSCLLSGMMALDPSIGLEDSTKLLNEILSGDYTQADGSAIRAAEHSEYALANAEATLFLSGRLTGLDEK